MNKKLSIIIVHYKVKDELFDCLKSIKDSKINFSYEVIVVENDEEKVIGKELSEKFPWVTYIESPRNIGFGAGNNLGAKHAKGEYLFFLNPDTFVINDSINKLISFLDKNTHAGIVAPLLLNPEKTPYPLQGSRTLTPLQGIVVLSFFNKLFPNNPISKEYLLADWDKRSIKEVDVVPGTAFVIRRKIFEDIGGFDEKFFMYYEESDICKRVKQQGYKIFMVPDAKIVHAWGSSTKKSKKNINKIISQSRFYYFRKHYGFFWAILVQGITSFGKEYLFLFFILILGIFLRTYRLEQNFSFDGEVGDNLLDIKNAFVHHYIPLVGPPTSHPWLHFGPLFYWIYGPVLALLQFNPISHEYFAVFIGLLIIFANYYFLRKIFSCFVAIVSSLFIAVSPMYLFATRLGRFTFIVPLFMYPFLWFLLKVLQGEKKYFFWLFLMLGIMLNFHYTPLFLIPVIIVLVLWKKIHVSSKDMLLSFAGLLIPLSPLLIADSQQKFRMSTNLLLWIPYRIAGFLGIYHKNTLTPQVLQENKLSFINFFSFSFTPTEYHSYTFVGLAIFFVILIFVTVKTISFYRAKTLPLPWLILFVWGFFGFLALFIHGDIPLHYFVPLFPLPFIFFSLLLESIVNLKYGKIIVSVVIFFLVFINLQYFIFSNWYYLPEKKNPYANGLISYDSRKRVAQFIVQNAQNKPYVLKRIGYNDFFEKQFAQNYIYLLWWYGNEPGSKAPITYTVLEEGSKLKSLHIKNSDLFVVNNVLVFKTH